MAPASLQHRRIAQPPQGELRIAWSALFSSSAFGILLLEESWATPVIRSGFSDVRSGIRNLVAAGRFLRTGGFLLVLKGELAPHPSQCEAPMSIRGPWPWARARGAWRRLPANSCAFEQASSFSGIIIKKRVSSMHKTVPVHLGKCWPCGEGSAAAPPDGTIRPYLLASFADP